MLDQLKALLWLRVILFRNTMSRGRTVAMVVLTVVYAGVCLLAVAGGVGLFFLAQGLDSEGAWATLMVADVCIAVFLFFWCFALLTELQRSEVIDFRKMLQLPISLRMVFGLNYAAALLSPALVIFALPVLGFCLGLTAAHGPHMLLGLPIAAMFYLMLASWTYYVRGVLSALMENKKRRRLVLTLLPLCFVLLGQLPNIFNHAVFLPRQKAAREADKAALARGVSPEELRARNKAKRPDEVRRLERSLQIANAAVPVGWLPYGLYALSHGRPVQAAACFAGMGALMALGLALGFRSTWRYYTGAIALTPKRAKPPPAEPKTQRRVIEWRLPFLDDDTAAMTMASLLTYLRQPNIYLMLVMPLVFGAVFLLYARRGGAENAVLQGSVAPMLVVIWPLFSFGLFLFNIFGIDGTGFRALILLPTDRRKYLLAKNLALFPIVFSVSLLFIILGTLFTRPGIEVFAMSVAQVVYLYIAFAAVGNLMSIHFPSRMAWQGLREIGHKSTTLLVALLSMLLIALLMIPTALCMMLAPLVRLAWGLDGLPLGLIATLALLALTAYLYYRSLAAAGNLLARREQWILDRLVRDRE